MSVSLFYLNVCQFGNCGLNFATLCDLLQHIEETHIPGVEAELKKKEEAEKAAAPQQPTNGDDTLKNPVASSATPTLPLSAVYKLFPVLPAQKARPVKYEPTRIAFCHYRRKLVAPPSNASLHYAQPNTSDKPPSSTRSEHDEEMSNDSFRTEEVDDGESCSGMPCSGDPEERRHKCPVDGCNKRYKNLQGARYHARQIHGLSEDATIAMTAVDVVSTASGSQSPLTQPSTPSKSASVRPYKCSQCSKRYKTIVGLNNHVQQSHQRVNTGVSNQSFTPSLVPVSPSAVSNSSTSHLHSSSVQSEPPVHSSTVVNKGMLSQGAGGQGQTGVSITSMHVPSVPPSGPPPGVRVTAQPIQTAPPPSAAGHQYHHQGSGVMGTNASTQSNIQVRTVGNVSSQSRASSFVGSQISFCNMVDGSQQTDQRSPIHQPQGKVPQRVVSAGNLSMLNRNQYQQNQSIMHRVKVATSSVSNSLGGQYGGGSSPQVVNITSSTQMPSSSALLPPSQSPQTSRSQVYQHQQS